MTARTHIDLTTDDGTLLQTLIVAAQHGIDQAQMISLVCEVFEHDYVKRPPPIQLRVSGIPSPGMTRSTLNPEGINHG